MTAHFDLDNDIAYQTWRKSKLQAYPVEIEESFIELAETSKPEQSALFQIKKACEQHNFALYRFTNTPANSKQSVHRLGQSVGLSHLDNNLCADDDFLTSITVTHHKGQHDYIPYTSKQLSWHVDGYYNKPEEYIYGFLLHCETPAIEGGESMMMDHEILYILLRDENPDWIKALMQPNAMTIPANILDGEVIRPDRTGAVFSIAANGKLHMRYSARKRNIQWAEDKNTQDAVAFIQQLWEEENSPYILRYILGKGEGIICNNILHRRTHFVDSDDPEKKRLLYRGRYYDSVESTQSLL